MGERIVEFLGDLRGVRGSGQQDHLGLGIEVGARTKWINPFCRVIPTKTTDGWFGSIPSSVTMSVSLSGANSAVSIPFLTTCLVGIEVAIG